MMIRPWFDRWPVLLDRQLKSLEGAGIRFRVIEEARARGILALELFVPAEGEELRLLVQFPSTFPYTRFEIAAPGLDLAHHQHPFSKNLCFIPRGTVHWREGETVGEYVVNRLPLVLRAGRTEERQAVDSIEEHQAEPFTDYYGAACEDGAIVLIDSAMALPSTIEAGDLVVGVPESAGIILGGALLVAKDDTGRVVGEADRVLMNRYPKRLRARWIRSNEPIREVDAHRFERVLFDRYPVLAKPLWQLVKGWKVDILGIVFPDEVKYRQTGDSWIFLIRGEELKDPGRRKSGRYLARAARAGRDDLAARVPELRTFAEATIVVIGLGGLGAPSALEFARAGAGELRILDGDVVDPGTAVRWPLGFPVAGRRKTEAIRQFIGEHYPYVKVQAWDRKLGLVGDSEPSDLEILDAMLDGASLVYDATAEVGLQHLLADLARERKIPYICVSSTAGAWGGMLTRIRPERTAGCWVCSQLALQDETIPSPPADPKGGIQPLGCADATFTGSSFDLSAVSSAGVRLGVSTVCASAEDGYPGFEWDVAILSMRDNEGRAIAPAWRTFPLARHTSCGCETA